MFHDIVYDILNCYVGGLYKWKYLTPQLFISTRDGEQDKQMRYLRKVG